jgi:hypothetical protein
MRLLAAAFVAVLAACTPSLPLTDDTPPLILTPAASAGLVDGRGRFRETLCAIDAVRGYYRERGCNSLLHRLNGEPPPTGKPVALGVSRVKLRIRIVPGIFGECAEGMATPFLDAVRPKPLSGYDLGQFGFDVAAFRVDGRSSSRHNAEQIRTQIAAMNLKPDERLVLIGHSKGMSDLIELIGGDRSVVPHGSSIVSLTGVVAGTPIADAGEGAYGLGRKLPLPKCPPGDGGGVTSLTRRTRLNYLVEHPLPKDLHYYSIAAYTRSANISSGLRPTHVALSKIDARNDGNVIFTDSILPTSTVLGYLDADHWAVAMPFEVYAPKRARLFANRNHFPRVVLLEAIARTIAETYELEGGR